MKKINPWKIDQRKFHTLEKIEDKVGFIAQYGKLAPSRYNSQPWIIEVNQNQIDLRLDKSKHLQSVDPNYREMYISCGAVITNIQIAAEHFDIYTKVQYFVTDDPENLVASIIFFPWEPFHKMYPADLFAAISERTSNRREYEQRPLTNETIISLVSVIDWVPEIYLHLSDESGLKKELHDLTREAQIRQHNTEYFNEEAAIWTGTNAKQQEIGIPIDNLTLPFYVKPVYTMLAYYGLTMNQAESDAHNIIVSPIVGTLLTEHDGKMDWLMAGIAYELLALRAASLGLQQTPITSMIEVDQTKEKLMNVLMTEKVPQMFFRVGYGKATNHTPRQIG